MLRKEADARGVFLSDEVMDFMLNRFSRDLGSLMELLDAHRRLRPADQESNHRAADQIHDGKWLKSTESSIDMPNMPLAGVFIA